MAPEADDVVPVLASGTTSGDLPSFLSQYQGVGDPEQPEEFRKLLRAVLRLDARDRVTLEGDPFIGLRAYDSTKAHLFFGREQETEELVDDLRGVSGTRIASVAERRDERPSKPIDLRA